MVALSTAFALSSDCVVLTFETRATGGVLGQRIGALTELAFRAMIVAIAS